MFEQEFELVYEVIKSELSEIEVRGVYESALADPDEASPDYWFNAVVEL